MSDFCQDSRQLEQNEITHVDVQPTELLDHGSNNSIFPRVNRNPLKKECEECRWILRNINSVKSKEEKLIDFA